MADVQEVLKGIEQRLAERPEKLAAQGTYQLDLTGDGGGTFAMIIGGGRGEIKSGPAENPGVVVTMTAQDFVDLATGKLNAMSAFMGGRLKIKGDMGLALKLQTLLS
ncbi:MAG: SCP2 sterol-binding domain-containing protein [Bacillota bacterium]